MITLIWYGMIWYDDYMNMNMNMNIESRYIKITFVVHLEIPARCSQEAPSHLGSHGFASPNALVFERWSWCLVILDIPGVVWDSVELWWQMVTDPLLVVFVQYWAWSDGTPKGSDIMRHRKKLNSWISHWLKPNMPIWLGFEDLHASEQWSSDGILLFFHVFFKTVTICHKYNPAGFVCLLLSCWRADGRSSEGTAMPVWWQDWLLDDFPETGWCWSWSLFEPKLWGIPNFDPYQRVCR